jgi:hypothetical protein
MNIASQVQIELVHGNDLTISAASSAAFDPERGPWFADIGKSNSLQMTPIACVRPIVVVDLPSPSGVGVMPATKT